MNDAKYIGLDVHQATICAAVLETILQFLRGVRGSLHVTFEEGTWAAWLHDLLKPHVTGVVVCDTRKTGLAFQEGSGHSRAESQLQPRSKKYLQGCGHMGGQ